MKKLFIPLVVFCICCTTAFSQVFIAKSSLIASGGLSIEIIKEKNEFGSSSSEDNLTSISLTPGVMYFVSDNLGVGANLTLSTYKYKESESSGSTIIFGPQVRYYFAEGPFAQASIGFGSQTSKNASFDTKDGIFQWELGVGYSVRISDTVLLDPMIGYGSQKLTDKDLDDYFTTFSGLFVRLGFTVILVNQ
jgi:hypothetical protein